MVVAGKSHSSKRHTSSSGCVSLSQPIKFDNFAREWTHLVQISLLECTMGSSHVNRPLLPLNQAWSNNQSLFRQLIRSTMWSSYTLQINGSHIPQNAGSIIYPSGAHLNWRIPEHLSQNGRATLVIQSILADSCL